MSIELTEELLKAATQYGYMGIFSHRDTMQQALDDATNMISAMQDDRAAAMTALMIFVNTNALAQAQRDLAKNDVVGELRELARATLAYCEQDSRSERRRREMIRGAQEALVHAVKEFGPEDT